MKHVSDTLLLLGSFLALWLWGNFGSTDLTVPLLGVLIFLYIASNVSHKITRRPRPESSMPHESFHALLLVITSLLLISSSGNLSSPFFFLLYFLPFALSFLLSPVSALTFATLASVFFFPSLLATDYVRGMLQIGSMIALSPIAYWAGSEYRHHLTHLAQNETIAEKVTKDIGKIITDEQKTLTHNESKALTDILEQIEVLKKEK